MPNTIEGVYAFALANPTHDGGTWHNWCESFVHRAGGFSQSFSTATLAGDASGYLNPDWRSAPRGALHYYGNGPGHIGFEGGGDSMLCASDGVTHLLTRQHLALGTVSHEDYARAKPSMRYRGWSLRHGVETLAPSTISAGVGTTTTVGNDMPLNNADLIAILSAQFKTGTKNPDGTDRSVTVSQALGAVVYYGDVLNGKLVGILAELATPATVTLSPADRAAIAALIPAPAPIDYASLAKAVNDDAALRLAQ